MKKHRLFGLISVLVLLALVSGFRSYIFSSLGLSRDTAFAASPITLLAQTQSTSGVSPAIDTTGATLIVIQEMGGDTSSPTDSDGNTWVGLSTYGNSSVYTRYFYACGPITSSGQTFTAGAGSSAILVAAYSGTMTSDCLDAGSNQGLNNVLSPASLPAITPSAPGDLIVSSMVDNATTHTTRTPNSGLSVIGTATTYAGGALAWSEDSSTNPLTVTWTQTPSWTYFGLSIAAFKAATSSSQGSAPVISSFSASPTSITTSGGGSSTLSWLVSGAASLSINNGVGSQSNLTSGSVSVSPTQTTAYVLTATNSYGSATANITLTVVDITPPSTPTDLSANAISSSQADLSWTASTDNIGVVGYQIFRGGVQVGTSTTASYTDTGLSASTTYTYTVSAYDAAGNVSNQSLSASVTTQAVINSNYDGSWTDLLNTHMHLVCPSSTGSGSTDYDDYDFYDRCGYVISDTNGATVDTKRDRLIVWGGGHGGYFGNELYALNLATATPYWTRLTNPSPWDFTDCPNASGTYTDSNCETNADGTPVSRHTYDDLVYLPTQDALFSFAGDRSPDGDGTNSTWLYYFASSTWQDMDPVNGYDPTQIYHSTYGANCAYDSVTDSVFCSDGGEGTFLNYIPSSNTYRELVAPGNASYQSLGSVTAAIDPVRRLMFFIGDNASGTLSLKAVDISGNDPNYTVQDWSSEVTGCAGMGSAEWPGFAYDSAIDEFVGFPGQGNLGSTSNTVYIFDPGTKSCSQQTTLTPAVPQATSTVGTFGRWNYVPDLNEFVLVNSVDNDAFTYTLQDQTSSTLPDIYSFSASSSIVAPAGTSTLNWNITNASSVAITPGSFSTSTLVGSIAVNPTSTITYTLTATNAVGILTATTTVTVNPVNTTPPVVTLGLQNASGQGVSIGGTADGLLMVTASATDPGTSGMALLILELDGAVVANTTSSSLTYTLNANTMLNANHTLTAVAIDNAGNMGSSATSTLDEQGFIFGQE